MKFHLNMKLATAVEMAYGSRVDQNRLKRMFDFDSVEDLRKELLSMIGNGMKYIPGANCDNQSDEGECLGHLT